MNPFLLTFHIVFSALLLGTLFVQSLLVVMTFRLKGAGQRDAVRLMQRRVQNLVYYPALVVAVATGFAGAIPAALFEQGKWLHWKLVLVVLLAGLGLITGGELARPFSSKPKALVVHILVFLLGCAIIYLSIARPF